MKGDTGTSMGGSVWVRPKKRSCKKCAYAKQIQTKGKSFCKRWKKEKDNKPDYHKCFQRIETAAIAGDVNCYRMDDMPDAEKQRMMQLFDE